MPAWALVTGEYPPQPGGVSDYTRLVARGLAEAGDEVQVFAPACREPSPVDPGVSVTRLEGGFSLLGLRRLGAALEAPPRGKRILVQYVPHAFGWKAMNVPFCVWLNARRDPVWVMFHEVAFPRTEGQPAKLRLLASVTRTMAGLALKAAERVFVSIPAWEPLLRSVGEPRGRVTWLPVPSTLPTSADPARARAHRSGLVPDGGALIGHFGTFGESIASLLREIVPTLLADERRAALLVGRGSEGFAAALGDAHPGLVKRVRATGALDAAAVVENLAACDLLVQPYPDGVSSRRTSVMAGLALGLPVVANEGRLSEAVWRESGAVALVAAPTSAEFAPEVSRLLGDRDARSALGARAAAVYAERFAIARTILALREQA
jgi:glycosyltransferase involved in cell wall biosynthesis